MKKYLLLIAILSLIYVGCQSDIAKNIDKNIKNVNGISTDILENKAQEDLKAKEVEKKTAIVIKPEVFLDVPFAVQFPTGNMNDPYQEACEETSIIIAKAFIDGKTDDSLDNSFVDQEINSMVRWQEENWGGHFDLDTKNTLKLFQDYYSLSNGEVTTINSVDDLKGYLSEDKIIIAPTYGMKLDNPYFTAPGPAFHMLVIKGYNDKEFITNDPGIGLGRDFKYTYDNLFNAIHDLPTEAVLKYNWIKDHPEFMDSGGKFVIVINR